MTAFALEDSNNKGAYLEHINKNTNDDKVTLKLILSNNQIVAHIALFKCFNLPEISYWIGKVSYIGD